MQANANAMEGSLRQDHARLFRPELYFSFFAKPPFPGFTGVLCGGGLVIGFLLKSASTDSTERNFVLFKNGEQPAEPTQAA